MLGPLSVQPHLALARAADGDDRLYVILVVHRWGCYDRTMAEAIAFDTHRFVKRLTESGFTEKQAETLAEEHVALLNANLATKADIAAVKADIARVEASMDALRQETVAGIEALRQGTRADIARVEAGIDALRQETRADVARVEAGIDALRQETRAEIEALRQETKAGIETVRHETTATIESVKADLVKWLFGALIAQGGLIVALVKLL